jgi:hypothetical protein
MINILRLSVYSKIKSQFIYIFLSSGLISKITLYRVLKLITIFLRGFSTRKNDDLKEKSKKMNKKVLFLINNDKVTKTKNALHPNSDLELNHAK